MHSLTHHWRLFPWRRLNNRHLVGIGRPSFRFQGLLALGNGSIGTLQESGPLTVLLVLLQLGLRHLLVEGAQYIAGHADARLGEDPIEIDAIIWKWLKELARIACQQMGK